MNSLTKIELDGLNYIYNLGDAHTRKILLKEYSPIVDDLNSFFRNIDLHDYYDLRKDFVEKYGQLLGQSYKGEQVLLSYASSISMEIIANFFRIHNLRKIALVEPTFDNIPDILARHGLELIPYSDDENYSVFKDRREVYKNCDVLFVTVPNNPTGSIIDEDNFKTICKSCYANKILLVIDACFRLFSKQMLSYDMRKISEEEGIDYIIIEDTGKYWPLHDLKIGMIACSQSIFDNLNNVHCDFLLNVSPFILNTIKSIIAIELNLKERPIVDLISRNRKFLRNAIKLIDVSPFNDESTISVEFIDITQLDKSSEKLCKVLKTHGVITLPGNKFYWNNDSLGEKYIRIALAREQNYFERSVERLIEVIQLNYNSSK